MSTYTEKRRAGFEAWFAERYTAHKLGSKMTNCGILTDGYSDSRVDLAWQAYNAALDSVSVELPPCFLDEYGTAYDEREIKKAIEAAGIRYK